MKNKIVLHQIVLFSVLLILTVTRWINQPGFINLGLLWWLLGSIFGFMFVFSDRLINALIINPGEMLTLRMKEQFMRRRFGDGLMLLLSERNEQRELMMRSFLFVLCWVVLAFWTSFSSNNSFANGLMLGIGTHLTFDLIYDYFLDKERFNMWFWQIKRTMEEDEKKWFVVITSVLYLLIAVRL